MIFYFTRACPAAAFRDHAIFLANPHFVVHHALDCWVAFRSRGPRIASSWSRAETLALPAATAHFTAPHYCGCPRAFLYDSAKRTASRVDSFYRCYKPRASDHECTRVHPWRPPALSTLPVERTNFDRIGRKAQHNLSTHSQVECSLINCAALAAAAH